MYVVFPDVPASVAVVAPVVPVADAVSGVAPIGYGNCPTLPIVAVPAPNTGLVLLLYFCSAISEHVPVALPQTLSLVEPIAIFEPLATEVGNAVPDAIPCTLNTNALEVPAVPPIDAPDVLPKTT